MATVPVPRVSSVSSVTAQVPRIQVVQTINQALEQTQVRWQKLCNHCGDWFYRPDMEAMEVIYSVAAAQFEPNMESIWIFLNGPSGSGKTSMGINSMTKFPNAHIIGEITPNTFLSCYNGSRNSFLHEVQSGILLFKDFTTTLSLRQEARGQIASQIREVSDGYFSKRSGVTNEEWRGKISAVAAVTPVIEHYWALMRNMGDRFIQVRWPRLNGLEVAKVARKQQGHEKFISEKMQDLAYDFFTGSGGVKIPPPDITDDQAQQLGALAEIVSYMRTSVERVEGIKEIRETPQIEQTGRLGKALPALARFHCSLFRKSVVDEGDMRIARRVALDSIPWTRNKIIRAMSPNGPVGCVDIMREAAITESALNWQIDELVAIGAIVIEDNGCEKMLRMSEHIKEMWQIAFPDAV